ncbi:MAG: hypothetical protein K2Q45_03090 [Nitrosomonas sp.]|nr:hypothetical protein [Nitrosomonas sp.]
MAGIQETPLLSLYATLAPPLPTATQRERSFAYAKPFTLINGEARWIQLAPSIEVAIAVVPSPPAIQMAAVSDHAIALPCVKSVFKNEGNQSAPFEENTARLSDPAPTAIHKLSGNE